MADEEAAYASAKAGLLALKPETADDERLAAVMKATVAAANDAFDLDALVRPHLAGAIDIANRNGLGASAALMKALSVSWVPGLALSSEQLQQRIAMMDEAVKQARAAGQSTELCLVLAQQAALLGFAVRPASEWTQPVFEQAAMTEAAPRCAARALSYLSIGLGTLSREAGGASGALRLDQDLNYAAQALRLAPGDKFPVQAGLVLMARGRRLLLAGRNEDALRDCQEAVKLSRKGHSRINEVRALQCTNKSLKALKRPGEALAAAVATMKLAEDMGTAEGIADAGVNLALSYASLDPPDSSGAESALQRAWAAVDRLGPRDGEMGRRMLHGAADIYARMGNFQRAYEDGQKAATLDAAALGKQQSEAMAELSAKLDLQGKQAELEKLTLREAQAATRRNALIVGLAFSVLALTIVAWLLRRQTQQRRRIATLYSQLETINADRSRFLAAACHDLRQPTYALGLLAEAASAAPERSAKYLSDIRRNTLTLGDMLSEVLDLTQLERGDYHATPGPVELDALLGEAAAQYSGIAARRQLALQVVPCGRWVTSDPYLLRRIVFNLVSNACKYTDQGSVVLDVVVEDDKATLRVTDTGRGIPADRINDMMRPYARMDHGAAEEGLGIGLSVVQRAVQLLGHRLNIASVVGNGTTVSLELSLTQAPAKSSEASEAVPIRGLVAVVDDNAEIREALVSMLREWGIDVVSAESGEVLLKALAARGDPKPSLLLTDYLLGTQDGLQLVKSLRKRPGWEQLPAVLVTGTVSAEAETLASAENVQVLIKPARPARLRQVMRRAMAS